MRVQIKRIAYFLRTIPGALQAAIIGIGLTVLFLFSLLRQPDEDAVSFGNNILVFVMVNLTIILLLVLVFLVGRNLLKLIFERKQGILGSKLRVRLVSAFVLLSCVPMAVSFFVATGLLNQAMDGWFSNQVETAVTESVTVARRHIQLLISVARQNAQDVARELNHIKASELQESVESLRRRYAAFAVRIVDPEGNIQIESVHATGSIAPFKEPEPDLEALKSAAAGKEVIRVEERGSSQFVRAYVPWRGKIVMLSQRVDPEIREAQISVNEAFKEYEQLKLYRSPLRSSYVLTLALANLLTLFGSLWVGFFIAKQLTGPIQRLAEGTLAIARGDYDFQIRRVRDDEMGYLVESFNRMISELKNSHETAQRRQLFIETILENLAVGVIALDKERVVTAVNSAAKRLFRFASGEKLTGGRLEEIISKDVIDQIEPLIQQLEKEGGAFEHELRLSRDGEEMIVLCTAGRIPGVDGDWRGMMLLFDDVTEMAQAQHHAAWRDVARRIAHEIKNPLTPIKLSAQRIERLLEQQEIAPAVKESVQILVEHVNIISRLANEFSQYARMPVSEPQEVDINRLVSSMVSSFVDQYPQVAFQVISDSRLPVARVDPEQIRSLMINLLTNAVSVLTENEESAKNDPPRIVIRTSYETGRDRMILEVADNGPGIAPSFRGRVFEPYFTTKKGGTGLGLSIVSAIVRDHNGEIRIVDNAPRGIRFVVSLPRNSGQAGTQRKLG